MLLAWPAVIAYQYSLTVIFFINFYDCFYLSVCRAVLQCPEQGCQIAVSSSITSWVYIGFLFSFSKYLLLMLNSEASCFCAGNTNMELVLQLANIFSCKTIKSIPYPQQSFSLQVSFFFPRALNALFFLGGGDGGGRLINSLSVLSKMQSLIPK